MTHEEVYSPMAHIRLMEAEIDRLRAASKAFLLEQTEENAKALAAALGWIALEQGLMGERRGRTRK